MTSLLEDFSDELLCAVLTFLPSVEDLKNLALTNRRWYTWVFSSAAADGVFRELYQHQFRKTQPLSCGLLVVEGRELWKDLHKIRHNVTQQNSTDRLRRHHHHYHHHLLHPSRHDMSSLLQHHHHPASQQPRRHRQLSPGRSHSPPRATAAVSSHRRSEEEEEEAPTINTSAEGRSDSPIPLCCSTGACAHNATPVHPLNTIEILPPEEEAEAIFYDHDFEFEALERQPCVGYFGFQPLPRLLKNHHIHNQQSTSSTDNSNNASAASLGASAGTITNTTTTPIAIWGDFPGLRVAPCWEALLNPRSRYRDRLVSVHDEKQSQVMDMIVHPQVDACSAVANSEQGYTSPFFLAFASGTVMTVAARDDEFKVLSTSSIHSCEVTCLTIVPISASASSSNTCTGEESMLGQNIGCLASACVNGQVFLYPDSLTKLSLTRAVCLNPHHIPQFPVFSMSATVFGPGRTVLCLGGQGLKLSLWELAAAKPESTSASRQGPPELEVIGNHDFEYEPHVAGVQNPDDPNNQDDDQVDHAITHVSFVGPIINNSLPSLTTAKKDLLVCGTSRGHIITYDLISHTEDPHRPHLQMYTSQEGNHRGSVEYVSRIGNVLFTSGGKDGVMKVFDLSSGIPLATLLVHPGRLLAPPTPAPPVRLKCAVVKSWICHERQSIICLCRDGHVNEWSFRLQTLAAAPIRHQSSSAVSAGSMATSSAKNKRSTSAGMSKTGKRPRRTGKQNHGASSQPAPNHQQDNALYDPTKSTTEFAEAKPRAAVAELFAPKSQSSPVVTNAPVCATAITKPESTLEPEIVDDVSAIMIMMKALTQEAKDLFYQLGFCKWNKWQRPVLILPPLSVPIGPIRDAWAKDVRAFLNRQQRGTSRNSLPPCLVHWLGSEDPRRAYSMVPVAKLTLHCQGIVQQFDQVPSRLQQLLEHGKRLSRSEREYVNGLALLPKEAAKVPEKRSHLLENFTKDDCTRKAHN